MRIQELKKYAVDGMTFDTKEAAQHYVRKQKNKKILVISTNPDLNEGRFPWGTKEVFTLELEEGQNGELLRKLFENVVGKQRLKYDGIQGSLDLVDNFKVEVLDYDKLIEVEQYIENNVATSLFMKGSISYSNLPNNRIEAMTYLEDLLK